ncbi:MAG: hypothetical protein WCK29_01520 [archaeon]
MTSPQSIEDRTLEYASRIEQRIEKLQTAYNAASKILDSHDEPAHERLENANLKLESIVQSDPVFLKLLECWNNTYAFYPANESSKITKKINDESYKIRSRTMDEKTYMVYLETPQFELHDLLLGGDSK